MDTSANMCFAKLVSTMPPRHLPVCDSMQRQQCLRGGRRTIGHPKSLCTCKWLGVEVPYMTFAASRLKCLGKFVLVFLVVFR